MRIYDAFSSRYVRAADLQGREAGVKIRDVKLENFRGRKAPVLYFEGKNKGLILNKTNASAIAVLYSEETDAWTGKEITIYPTMVEFQGRMVQSIRVKGPKLRNVTKTAG
jgi:hypothetical protein